MQPITDFLKTTLGKLVVSGCGLLAVCFICLICGSFIGSDRGGGSARAPATAAPTELPPPATADDLSLATPSAPPVPTETSTSVLSLPTDTPTPASTLPPEQALRAKITQVLGESNRGQPKIITLRIEPDEIFLHWTINDNLTANMRAAGAQIEVTNVLKAIAESGIEYRAVKLWGSFAGIEQFGNQGEMRVVEVWYSKETVDKINWAGFDRFYVYTIADGGKVHPEFVAK